MKALKTLLVFLALALSAQAQDFMEDPRYGNTPEERQANLLELQFFRDAYNNKDFDAAADHLRTLLAGAPKSSESIYVNGAAIYRSKILRATSLAEKNLLIDTLMSIYDQRVEHFGLTPQSKARMLVLKAREHLSFRQADREQVRRMFLAALESGGDNPDRDAINIYYNELSNDFKASQNPADAEALFNEYERWEAFFESPEYAEAKTTFEAIFATSGAASCQKLEEIYRPRIEAASADTLLLERVFNMLIRTRCTESDFMAEVGEKYYAAAPKSETAVRLAMMFEERKEYSKALRYLNENIARESDPLKKSDLLVRAAASTLGSGSASQAASLARQAADANPENGYAYMILGSAYAQGASGCSDFNRGAVYWLVYDVLTRARAILAEGDAEAKQQAENISVQLGGYRAAFPTKEDCFFNGLSNGQSYTVSCGWVSGRTSVRER